MEISSNLNIFALEDTRTKKFWKCLSFHILTIKTLQKRIYKKNADRGSTPPLPQRKFFLTCIPSFRKWNIIINLTFLLEDKLKGLKVKNFKIKISYLHSFLKFFKLMNDCWKFVALKYYISVKNPTVISNIWKISFGKYLLLVLLYRKGADSFKHTPKRHEVKGKPKISFFFIGRTTKMMGRGRVNSRF